MRFHRVAMATGLLLVMTGCGRQVVMPSPAPAAARKPPRVASRPPVSKPPASKLPAARTLASRPAVRPVRVDSARLETALLAERSHAPLTHVLLRRSGNAQVSDRAAAAVVRESRRLRMSASLVAAVLLIENTPLDTTAMSDAGAIGLMQVMPVHGGGLGCPSAALLEVESNICHGARVLHMYLLRNRTVQAALRRYNGCVGRLTTRRCLYYPAHVLRTASRIRREMLSAPVDFAASGPPPLPPYYLRRAASFTDSQPAWTHMDAWTGLPLQPSQADPLGSPATTDLVDSGL